MAHFAQLNDKSLVLQVILVSNDELLDSDGVEQEAAGIAFCQSLLGSDTRWVQTSYNASFRKNYAGLGYSYDKERDAFIPPQPYPSWVLIESTCQWEAPAPMPDGEGLYQWNEDSLSWSEISSNSPV